MSYRFNLARVPLTPHLERARGRAEAKQKELEKKLEGRS